MQQPCARGRGRQNETHCRMSGELPSHLEQISSLNPSLARPRDERRETRKLGSEKGKKQQWVTLAALDCSGISSEQVAGHQNEAKRLHGKTHGASGRLGNFTPPMEREFQIFESKSERPKRECVKEGQEIVIVIKEKACSKKGGCCSSGPRCKRSTTIPIFFSYFSYFS